jgi:hypothetical protein
MRRLLLPLLAAGIGVTILGSLGGRAAADPNDPSQLRTMSCDNGRTVEAIIHTSNTGTLHITTTTENFVSKRIIRDGQVLFDIPGFESRPLVTCETVEFDLTVIGFFTPREP